MDGFTYGRWTGHHAMMNDDGLERLWTILSQVSPHTLRTKEFMVEMLTFIYSNRDHFGSISSDHSSRFARRLRSPQVDVPLEHELLEDLLEVGTLMMQQDCAFWLEAKALPSTVLDSLWKTDQVHQIQHIFVLEHLVQQFNFPRSSWHDFIYQAIDQLETHTDDTNPTFIMDIHSTIPEGLRQSLADPQFWYVYLHSMSIPCVYLA